MSGHSRTLIHIRTAHQREFGDVFAGKQLFLLTEPYANAMLEGDIVTLRELNDATGERTGRELVADVRDVVLLDHRQIVGIMPRKYKVVFSGRD